MRRKTIILIGKPLPAKIFRWATLLIVAFLVMVTGLKAQSLCGRVVELNEKGEKTSVPYANVFWLGTRLGTATGNDGRFSLKRPAGKGEHRLVVAFVGYKQDTLLIRNDQDSVEIVLQVSNQMLETVEVKDRNTGTAYSMMNSSNTQVISSEGIQRLACCSLADCFVNNATVDVGFTDAVSGAKQIQMLGLAGVYSQLLIENQPSMRILATTYGLNFIPGPWLSSISISKGASSVMNGFESITGQINVDLKKPEASEKFYLDLFVNDYLRAEVNSNASFKLSKNLSTLVLLNFSSTSQKVDRNGDGFMDVPLSTLVTGSNRWFYNKKGKIRSRFGFDLLWEDRTGGQTDFDPETMKGTTQAYGITLTTKRLDLFENTGFSINSDRNASIGINADFILHDQQSLYGINRYDAVQRSGYFNALLISDIRSPKHKITAGMSLQYDYFRETLTDTIMVREETVPGVYGEYTFNDQKHWTLLAGLRCDYDNLYGWMLNPRMHLKYSPWKSTTIRASAGSGMRTANVIPEHIGLLASSRRLVFEEEPAQERAWNYGISIVQKFPVGGNRKGTFTVDFFRTDFQNQVVVDVDRNPEAVYIYNLQGPSYSNSFQADLVIEPVKRFEITMAYRFSDVQMTVDHQLQEVPLTPRNRALIALHYATKYEKWKFSLTGQYFGSTRLPDTQLNPEPYRLPETSPGYFLFYVQVTFKFWKCDTFVGCENITNYKQSDPILAADDPFGKYFDTSIVYAPILGRQFNFGLRFRID